MRVLRVNFDGGKGPVVRFCLLYFLLLSCVYYLITYSFVGKKNTRLKIRKVYAERYITH